MTGRSPPHVPKEDKHKISKATKRLHLNRTSPRLQRLLLEQAALTAQDQIAANERLMKAHDVRARLAMMGQL